MSLFINNKNKYDFCKLCPLGQVPSRKMQDLCLQCAAKEITSPHGDLIDRNLLLKELSEIAEYDTFIYTATAIRYVQEAPTVIEAEE